MVAEPEVGRHRPRRDVVDADALRAELLRQGLGEVEQRRLGGAVVDHAAVRLEERVDRRDVDDRARRPASSIWATAARVARSAAKKLSCIDALEVVVAHVEEAVEPELRAADVVDEDVDASVPSTAVVDESLRAAGLDEVDGDRGDAVDSLERVDVCALRRRRGRLRLRASCTIARPMPLLPPVTTATLPSSSRSMFSPLSGESLLLPLCR